MMNMRNKLLIWILSLCMLLCLSVGVSADTEDIIPAVETTVETAAETTAEPVAEVTAEPVDEPVAEVTAEPVDEVLLNDFGEPVGTNADADATPVAPEPEPEVDGIATLFAAAALETKGGTNTYTLFNSGCTGDGKNYSSGSSSNPNERSLTNNGYDIYAENSGHIYADLGLSFKCTQAVTELATLTIYAFDVDEPQEVDYIYLVDETAGTSVRLDGHLSGMNQQWNTTKFRLDKSLFTVGHTYHFRLHVSVSGWVVYIRNVTLELTTDGETAASNITAADFSAAIDSSGKVTTTLALTVQESASYSVEYKAARGGTQFGSGFSTITATAAGTVKTFSFNLESGAAKGTYTIDAILKDASGSVVKTLSANAGYSYASVNYNANGGSSNLPNDTKQYSAGDTVTVLFDYVPSKAECVFAGWSRTRDAAVPEFTADGVKTFTIGSSDVTLYAIFTQEHNYVTHPAKAATCTEYGWDAYKTCSHCGFDGRVFIEPLGHSFAVSASQAATCTEDGYILYACGRAGCGATKRQTLSALGHDYVDGVCTRCGKTLPQAHEHAYQKGNTVEPTCVSIGYTVYTCDCGDTYRGDIIEQLGHKWDAGTVVAANTCTADGLRRYSCTRCDAFYEEMIPAAHDWEETVVTPATCTQNGKATRVCRVCGAEETVILPAGHKWDAGKVTVAPTCVDAGKMTRTCTVCGKSEEVDVPALGHHFVNGICTRCGMKFIDTVTPQVEHPLYGMYFEVDEIVSNYGPSLIDEYGVYLAHNAEAEFDKVAVYLTQDGTMWRRCIACTGKNITSATYVPYLSLKGDLKYSGLNSEWINTFPLSRGADGIWRYSDYATIGVNLEDKDGNLLLSLYDIGQAGKYTRIFDDLDEMKAWLLSDDFCAHVWDAGVVTKPATATETGIRTYTCRICGEKRTEDIPKLSDAVLTVVAPGHVLPGETFTVKVALSGNPGIWGVSADIAYDGDKLEFVSSKNGDIFADSAYIGTPSDKNPYRIMLNDLSRLSDVDKDGLLAEVTFRVKDSAPGANIHFSLRNVEAVNTDEQVVNISALSAWSTIVTGHNYGPWKVRVAAKCETTGVDYRTCVVCGHEETRESAALGHNYATAWTIDKPETCTVPGSKSHHCTRCDAKTDVTEIPAAGHKFGEWKVRTPAKCETTGVDYHVCSVCRHEETRTTDKLGHNYATTWTIDKPETCTVPGSKSHHCTRCDAKTDVTEIPAAGHKFGEWKVRTPAKCETTGVDYHVCSVCRHEETRTTDKLGHNYATTWTIDKPETCTVPGSKSHHCTRCDAKTDVTEIPVKAHTYGAWKVRTPAKCETTGVDYHVCSVCRHEETRTTDKLGHNYATAWTIDKPETCTVPGSKSHHCTRCDAKTDVTEIPVKGHNMPTTPTESEIAPTISTEGRTAIYRCQNPGCDYFEGGETIPKKNSGDVNGDYRISKLDLLRLQKYLAGWDVEIDKRAADCNGDGKITKADLLRLQKYLAGWDVKLGE